LELGGFLAEGLDVVANPSFEAIFAFDVYGGPGGDFALRSQFGLRPRAEKTNPTAKWLSRRWEQPELNTVSVAFAALVYIQLSKIEARCSRLGGRGAIQISSKTHGDKPP
jgi:hypothetical protein